MEMLTALAQNHLSEKIIPNGDSSAVSNETNEDPNDVPQFTNFMLAAEPVSTNPNHLTPLGIITVKNGDPMVMYSGRCRNSIKESSSSMKSQISVTKRHQMIL